MTIDLETLLQRDHDELRRRSRRRSSTGKSRGTSARVELVETAHLVVTVHAAAEARALEYVGERTRDATLATLARRLGETTRLARARQLALLGLLDRADPGDPDWHACARPSCGHTCASITRWRAR